MRDLQGDLNFSRAPGEIFDPLFTNINYTEQEAEMEVESAMKAPTDQSVDIDETKSESRRESGETLKDDVTPPAIPNSNQSSFPHPTTPGQQSDNRRRAGPPGSIPNFPDAMTPREPKPFFNSPITSPPAQSPMSSPPSRTTGPLKLPSQPFMLPTPAAAGTPASPWLQLAATSGAPTPSIDGPGSGPGRSSPHLGYPFERLNIGGSWSGANLWGGGDQTSSTEGGRRSSVDMSIDPPSSPSQPSRSSSAGMSLNPDTLARYRMMAGKASANSNKGKDVDNGHSIASQMSTSSTQKPPLPAALANRRASLPKNVLGGMLSPPLVTGSKAPSPLASSTPSPSPNPGLRPLAATSLRPLLNRESTLILDLRPPSAYQISHLPSAHSIPVPSTLLRRPAFTISKLAQMLSQKSSEAVLQWRNMTDIIVIDTDSTSLGANSILEGVAGKFEREGYSGNRWFVKGGYAAVEAAKLQLVTEEEEAGDDSGSSGEGGGLQFGRLGKLAFSQESTGSNLQAEAANPALSPTSSGKRSDLSGSIPSSNSTEKAARQKPSLKGLISMGSTSSLSGSSGRKGSSFGSQASQSKVQPANPFFDNIRQNLELSHGGGREMISVELPKEAADRADELPPWLAELARMPDEESAQRLAGEFYQVERGEQKRLQAVMTWHSNSSGGMVGNSFEGPQETNRKAQSHLSAWSSGNTVGQDYFPYSITAGVEQGSKNRYKNIWPYDFSRVRLETPPINQDDYINASYVQPRGTSRRYIATQGPMDATYQDFWLLVWEQRVSVIVMLTKQYEGGTIKCGNYWQDEHYGPLHVQLISQTGGEDSKPSDVSGFDFGLPTAKEKSTGNIRRVFTITRDDKPNEPPRRIVQIQCTTWPDFDVPETPDVLLSLLHDVDEASEESGTTASGTQDRADHPPVLVHCSAGVGRTGTFIIVDAMIDALKRERSALLAGASSNGSSPILTSPSKQVLHGTALPSLPRLSSTGSYLDLRDGSADQESRSSGGESPVAFGVGSATASARGSSAVSGTGSGSGDSAKSVSFLIPPNGSTSSSNTASAGGLPPVFTSSPHASATKLGHPSSANLPPGLRPSGSSELDQAIPHLEDQAEKMDIDKDEPTEDEKRKSIFDDLFTKHRGEGSGSSVSDSDLDIARRPSLASTSGWGSAEQINQPTTAKNSLYDAIGMPVPIVKSSDRHRTPSPVLDLPGLSPVASVLEGMRMQRMSLVQSLRQYLYVHRAIIQSYLRMVDEDKAHGREIIQESRPTLISASSHNTTSSSTDEEGLNKRRASPTELVPEEPGVVSRDSKASLVKRPSFKKMRPAA